jgi:type VI protein secretion system component Hcp
MAAFSSIDRAKISIGVLLRGILAIVFLSSLIPAHALAERIPAYMSLEGENQGKIEGGSTEKGHEGEIVVYAINHNVHIPRDPNSGLPSGNRIHAPLSVVERRQRD